MRLKKALFLPALALVLSTGWQSSSSLFEYAKNLEIFNQLFKELGDQYVDEIPSGQLIKTGIDAMLAKLDPYTNFFSEDTKGALAGHSISLDDSWGLGLEAGVDIDINNDWFVSGQVWYLDIDTEASLSGPTFNTNFDVEIDPWIVMLGIGTKF